MRFACGGRGFDGAFFTGVYLGVTLSSDVNIDKFAIMESKLNRFIYNAITIKMVTYSSTAFHNPVLT